MVKETDIIRYIKNLENPVIFDVENTFLYFPIDKNAQTSIARNLLKFRCIVRKDNEIAWNNYFSNNIINKDSLDKYFKFGVLRNPYSKFVSAYFHLGKILV